MRVRVLYFAGARDAAERKDESLAIGDGTSLEELSAEIFRLHPALGRLARSVRFSVNLEVADAGTVLHESDVVGVLPPVAGG